MHSRALQVVLQGVWALLLGGSMLLPAHAENSGTAWVLQIKGAIGPATSDYVERGLGKAAENHAELVILRLDTPGGLDSAMREIIKAILASPVPVVSYVSPPGARAASAGTYILYASQVAAMAPATNLGSATPVQIGGLPGVPDETPAKNGKDKSEQGEKGAMHRKIMNDAAAYIRGLAERYGRNADWAEKAVREASNLSADEALKLNVVDLVAASIPDLLKQLNGRKVVMDSGTRVLHTENLTLHEYQPDWRSRLLAVITDPNVAYLLMLVGIYGLFFELANPGSIFPGVAGAICILLALYAFQVLPVNYAGLALIILGIGFMIAEAFVPSFGALGLGGVVAFVTGSVILLDEGNLGISLPLIIGTALLSVGFFLWVMGRMLRFRRRRAVTGREELLDAVAEAMEDFEHEGRVRVHSESWRAVTDKPVQKGQRLRIRNMKGLVLEVTPDNQSVIEGGH